MAQDEGKRKRLGRDQVPLYGCTRCRYATSLHLGCDAADCNPHRYLATLKRYLAEGLYDSKQWRRKSLELFKDGVLPPDAQGVLGLAEELCLGAPAEEAACAAAPAETPAAALAVASCRLAEEAACAAVPSAVPDGVIRSARGSSRCSSSRSSSDAQ